MDTDFESGFLTNFLGKVKNKKKKNDALDHTTEQKLL